MPPTSTLAAEGRSTGRISADELFARHIALADANPPRHPLVPPDVRRAAFASYQSNVGALGKGGRDWKYDYERLASELPWDEAGGVVRAQAQILSDADATLRSTLAGSVVPVDGDPFASLAYAFAENGILLHVPAGTREEEPLRIEHDVQGAYGSTFLYTLVVVEEGAHATVVEDLHGSGFASGVVEIVLRDRASVDYVVVQRTAGDATIFMNRGVACAAGATGRFFVAELGACLSRSLLTSRLQGHGAHAEVDALFFNSGEQHVELATLADHAVGDCTSRTVVKSAARDNGQGRYFGNIRIAEHANGSDASLRDDALLLSAHAHIDSVPALEIKSNDVKAFHGATIGSIGEDELFYAQSRGIPRADAERMIALGFFDPLVTRFPGEALRETVRAALATKAGPAGRETL